MKKKECFNEKLIQPISDVKSNNSDVHVLLIAQYDFTLNSTHKFQKYQYIFHHACTTKKSCEHFFDDNMTKSDLYLNICSGLNISQSQLFCFIKTSKNPNCFLVKNYINNELNLGVYALRDIGENEELSICENIENSLEITSDFGLSFPKVLDPIITRAMYLKKLLGKLNDNDLDIFELNSLEISFEERNYLNNFTNLDSITQSLEHSILSHFSSNNPSPKFLYSLTNTNKITLASLTKTALKLFNFSEKFYNQVYLIISLEVPTITLTQKLYMLLNTYRLFLLWINCEHTFTYASRFEQFIICYVISFNSLMENWISNNYWAKLLLSIGVLTNQSDEGQEICEEEVIERFKWLHLRCLDCVEFKFLSHIQ
ncbi:12198_t:CDS:2 [Funneliformis mosseae]|uniref:12198_t:CDS:1 n=1 Tax=Funneliformis mosseae TaxID=27381 RepID=A0A9N9C6L2_FUNMO|nr:12198_t:CDS:2 [Funneliformis mosseae]